jgi:hypothetical protein
VEFAPSPAPVPAPPPPPPWCASSRRASSSRSAALLALSGELSRHRPELPALRLAALAPDAGRGALGAPDDDDDATPPPRCDSAAAGAAPRRPRDGLAAEEDETEPPVSAPRPASLSARARR